MRCFMALFSGVTDMVRPLCALVFRKINCSLDCFICVLMIKSPVLIGPYVPQAKAGPQANSNYHRPTSRRSGGCWIHDAERLAVFCHQWTPASSTGRLASARCARLRGDNSPPGSCQRRVQKVATVLRRESPPPNCPDSESVRLRQQSHTKVRHLPADDPERNLKPFPPSPANADLSSRRKRR